MNRFIPRRHEIALFAILAILFAIIVSLLKAKSTDLGMAAFAFPMFLVAAVLGLRRSPAWNIEASEDPEDDEVI